MSLLLKALQRASKSREGLASALPDAGDGLALEIEPGDIEPPRAGRRELDFGARAANPSAGGSGIGSDAEGSRARGDAGDRFDFVEWIRDHPVHLFAAAALLFLVGYFIYVYIAISNPAFFAGGGNRQPVPAAPPRAASPPAEPPGALPAPEPVPAPMPAVDTAAAPPATALPTSPPAADSLPIAPGSLSMPAGGPAADAAPRIAMADPSTATTRPPRRAPRDGQSPRSLPSTESAQDAPLQEGVRVRATDAGSLSQTRLTEAYEALQRRDLDRARTLYESVTAADDRNVDALLGLAATAWQQGQADRAADHYYRVLQLDPQNAAAQAGLIGLSGQVDPVASETRLKQLITRDPSALLYAALGHLYASQAQWSNAQQAYFQAHQLEPANPDFAYNLAVGLEHVGQRNIAVGYYRKALDLARSRGRAGFDPEQVAARVAKLSPAVE